jgi:hypothetical protein
MFLLAVQSAKFSEAPTQLQNREPQQNKKGNRVLKTLFILAPWQRFALMVDSA